MKIPPNLAKGDEVALIAPSFGCTTEPYATRLDVSIANWKKRGHPVKEGKNVRLAEGVLASASPKERAEEFMEAYASNAKLVLSVGGGEMMCEMLPFVDFEAIKALPPKWFMGFSDNANLTFPLTTLCDLVTVYGSCAPSYFQKKWRFSEEDAYRMLLGETHFEGYPKWSVSKSSKEHPLWGYRLSQPKVITPYRYEKPIEGLFLGGCLDCLINLCGTKFDHVKEFVTKHPEGIVWYLEACDLNVLSLRRAYFQLREAGWFENAKGFLLGRMLSAREEILDTDCFASAIDILGPLGKPILMDVDLGHLAPSMPFLNGAKGMAKLEKGNLIIDYIR